MTKRRRANVEKGDSEPERNGVNDSDNEVQNTEKSRRSRGATQKVKYFESDDDTSGTRNGRKSGKRESVKNDEDEASEKRPSRKAVEHKTSAEEVDSAQSESEEKDKPRRHKDKVKKVYKELDESTNSSVESNGIGKPKKSSRRTKKINSDSEADDAKTESEEKDKPRRHKDKVKKAYKELDESTNSSVESNGIGKPKKSSRRTKKINSDSEADDAKTNGNNDKGDDAEENGESRESESSSEKNIQESSNISRDESEEEIISSRRNRRKNKLNETEIVKTLNTSSETGSRRSRKNVKYIEDESDNSGEISRGRKPPKNDSDFEEENNEEEDNEEEDNDEGISAETTESESPPRKKNRTETDGRRSGRERKTTKQYQVEISEKKTKKAKKSSSEASEGSGQESESESEYEKVKKRKKKKNVGTQKRKPIKKFVSKKRKRAKSYEGSGDESSDEETYKKNYKYSKKSNSTKKSPHKKQGATSGRSRGTVNYAQSESDTHSDTPGYVSGSEVEEIEIDGIDQVCDHRQGKVGATGENTKYFDVLDHEDPNEKLETTETETQFLIKWKGLSHINNTWETEKTLDAKKKGLIEVKGLRRLQNYQNKLSDYNIWKKRANPEDVEYQEIDVELGRELVKTYKEVERIFSRRKNEENVFEYYVKWKNLPYIEATWEAEPLIKTHYNSAFEEFKRRKRSKNDPKDYKESMKTVKKKFVPMKEQPDYIGSKKFRMRDYQLDGINFLLNAWHKNNSIILADEMGLGKTIQTITFLKYLFHNYSFKGPMLVCVPLSTIAAWQKEFEQWAPDINAITYIGDAKSREVIRDFECENEHGEISFNVLLTSYEMVSKDRNFFEDIIWSNVVVDEAHRLKSDDSLLYRVLVQMDSHHRLLLTGTPLQNNLRELWCLLNFLRLPEIDDWESFEADYGTPEDRASGYVKLHSLLKPYIIRRLKKDVEKSLPGKVEQILRVDMTIKQKKLYKLVLTKNYQSLSNNKNKISLLNIMMQLRKTCNHGELIQEVDLNHQQTAEERLQQIIYGSGKLLLLDKLLTRFREKGDRVLIFSQMVIMLNIMEEYMELKRYPYQRLDGSVSSDKRKQAIAAFNAPGSPDFCFLLSTKAGGLGINLQTANRVIIFDSDFNPQNDLQAIARAHRIGQKEEVKIFRLVASSSVDEDIIQRAKNKMVLDHLVIQNMDTTGKTVISGKKGKDSEAAFNKDELNTIIKFGAADLFKENEDGSEEQDKEVDLDAILEKAELREEEEAPQSEANKELLSAFKCTTLTFEETEQDMDKDESKPSDWADIIPSAMREQHKPKQDFEGLELYSDNEDLYNPIANRRKARTKKVTKSVHIDSDGEGDKGSDYKKSDHDESSSDGIDSDASEGTKKAKILEREKEREKEKEKKKMRSNPVRSLKCLECEKVWADRKNLKRHMVDVHKQPDFVVTVENYHNLPEIKSDKNYCIFCSRGFLQDKLGYQIHINSLHSGVEPEVNYDLEKMKEFMNNQVPTKRQVNIVRNMVCLECGKGYVDAPALRRHMKDVHKKENYTASDENYVNLPEVKSAIYRCFPCSKSFNKLGYRIHIKHKHQAIEPPVNFDAVKLAQFENLTKMMICLVCQTRLGDPYALKKHMLDAHSVENYEIQDDNYFNLPNVQSTQNRCMPCSRLFAKSVLYRLHIKNKHGAKEPEENINPVINALTSTSAANLICLKTIPASLKIKLLQPQPQGKAQLEKNWMCAQCKKCFKDQKYLRKHMQDVHKLEPLSLTKEDYLELPSVESTHNRCLPCNKTFPNSLRYRIHIKDSHEKTEPVENYDAENCAQPEDFICLICIKKFVARNSLRKHIYKTHLGLTSNPEDEKDAENDLSQTDKKKEKEIEELDPLADPLDITETVVKVADPEDVSSKDILIEETKAVENDSKSQDEDDKANNDEESKLSENQNIQTTDADKENKEVELKVKDNETEDLEKSKSEEKEDSQDMDIDKNINEGGDSVENKTKEPEKDIQEMDVDNNIKEDVDIKIKESEEGLKTNSKEKQENPSKTAENNVDDDIVIIEEPKTNGPTKNLSEKEKMLIDKMLHMLKKYGCAFCSNRFDTKYALSFHERTHLKEKKTPKKEVLKSPKKPKTLDDDGTPKISKNTKMGSVQLHDNVSGPVCFKCNAVCKDNSNYKNHILSHYYREFDPHVPQIKPFECPVCQKPSRDKITLIRHYAFTHQKMFELTDITPEQLLPAGSTSSRGTPKTPRPKANKLANDSSSEMTPKSSLVSVADPDSPPTTESDMSVKVQSNGADKKELDAKDDKDEELVNKNNEEKLPEEENKKETDEHENIDACKDSTETETVSKQNSKGSDEDEKVTEKDELDEKDVCDTESKLDNLKSDLSDNKENEEEVI
eukprot:GFUD01033937.1.p1 GENE.GFUD01033937.1~~GFUD01033937.1.p1  ORF type:complete len:2371 (-),score=719.51 GFUD01033937.1:118-7230(-)